MSRPIPMVTLERGGFLESQHTGSAVICDSSGNVRETFGNPDQTILPRSAIKMMQALPLIESGAADAFNLSPQRLALACASHQGAPLHVTAVSNWLSDIDCADSDFTCGPQTSRDPDLRDAMIREGRAPCRIHNNCSGKHTGFLTLAAHLGADKAGYTDTDHPVQRAVLEAWERMTDTPVLGHGIDGCSAPNFASPLAAIAGAMGRFAGAPEGSAPLRLHRAMAAHPELVAGEGRACTRLMRAMNGRAAVKTGAEGVFTAILPDQGLGIALKITDGATRAAECAMAALLVRCGALDPNHPEAKAYLDAPITNWDGLLTGRMRPAPGLL